MYKKNQDNIDHCYSVRLCCLFHQTDTFLQVLISLHWSGSEFNKKPDRAKSTVLPTSNTTDGLELRLG